MTRIELKKLIREEYNKTQINEAASETVFNKKIVDEFLEIMGVIGEHFKTVGRWNQDSKYVKMTKDLYYQMLKMEKHIAKNAEELL